ncbi:partial agmatine deiminase, partial [Methylacidimicrobium cyclopophantes]
RAAAFLGMRCFEPGIVLEGGAIDTNGEGLFLVGSRCLLDPIRNPGMTRERMERALREYVGAERIIWLEGEIVGDDTDGHVDEIARFVGRSTIVAARAEDPQDPNHAALEENFARLLAEATKGPETLRVVPLPMPGPIYEGETRLPASYANFYFANEALLFPAFGDPMDAVAGEILGELVRDRPAVPVAARDLVWGFGGLHCITQQEPA